MVGPLPQRMQLGVRLEVRVYVHARQKGGWFKGWQEARAEIKSLNCYIFHLHLLFYGGWGPPSDTGGDSWTFGRPVSSAIPHRRPAACAPKAPTQLPWWIWLVFFVGFPSHSLSTTPPTPMSRFLRVTGGAKCSCWAVRNKQFAISASRSPLLPTFCAPSSWESGVGEQMRGEKEEEEEKIQIRVWDKHRRWRRGPRSSVARGDARSKRAGRECRRCSGGRKREVQEVEMLGDTVCVRETWKMRGEVDKVEGGGRAAGRGDKTRKEWCDRGRDEIRETAEGSVASAVWHVNTAAAARAPSLSHLPDTRFHRGASLCEPGQCGRSGKYHRTSSDGASSTSAHSAARPTLISRSVLPLVLNTGWPDQHQSRPLGGQSFYPESGSWCSFFLRSYFCLHP